MSNITSPTLSPCRSSPPPSRREPLIVIIGSTGTGKSNLAVSLARTLCSSHPIPSFEIINADAMQLYTGLPVITNKIPEAEQQGVPHHLLGQIQLDEEPWTVQDYVRRCDEICGGVRDRGNTPIVVGGTGYYVHGLLLGDGILGAEAGEVGDIETRDDTAMQPCQRHAPDLAILEAPTKVIYAKLQEVDPAMAQTWHPNDRRKIQRSLEVWLRTGKRASDVYAAQKARRQQSREAGVVTTKPEEAGDQDGLGSEGSGSRLRHDALILWLDAEDEALKDRLNRRVDVMVQQGLFDEAREMADFERTVEDQGAPPDRNKGIWVSIGYKELEPWLDHVRSTGMVTEGTGASSSSTQASALQQSCIEAVKAGTRRYAKRQNRYIRIRLANALADADALDRLFLLDCTDGDNWQDAVVEPASGIVRSFLNGEELPQPADLSPFASEAFAKICGGSKMAATDRGARVCGDCKKTLMTEKEWLAHIKSRSHKKVIESIRRRALNAGQRSITTDAPG